MSIIMVQQPATMALSKTAGVDKPPVTRGLIRFNGENQVFNWGRMKMKFQTFGVWLCALVLGKNRFAPCFDMLQIFVGCQGGNLALWIGRGSRSPSWHILFHGGSVCRTPCLEGTESSFRWVPFLTRPELVGVTSSGRAPVESCRSMDMPCSHLRPFPAFAD